MRAFFSRCEWGLFAVVCGLLFAVASLVAERRLWGTRASVVAALGLSSSGQELWYTSFNCSVAYGVFLHQGLNLCLLHWQADSLLLSNLGSPWIFKCNKDSVFKVNVLVQLHLF